jgi:plasmid stabilization system protein ParE
VSLVYHIRILPSALQDASECYNYIAIESPIAANKWFNGLFDAVDSLSNIPNRCPIAPETYIIGREIRVLIYRKNYRILFAVEKDIVRIYHINHAARNIMTKEEFLEQLEIDDAQDAQP